jgi:hypothetical protein
MKNKERFDRTIKVLVNAFFNGTLAKGTCAACAVGNMVAAAIRLKLTREDMSDVEKYNVFWMYPLNNYRRCNNGFFINDDHLQGGKEQIEATGYSVEEINKIEYTFEKYTNLHFTDYYDKTKEQIMEDQYNGLMAVVDVLCEIEGIQEVQQYKEMFAYVGK